MFRFLTIRYEYSLLFIIIIFFSCMYICINNYYDIILIIIVNCLLIAFNSFYTSGSLILLDDKILFKSLLKNKYNISSLLFELKKNKIAKLNNNYCAVLKNNKIDFYIKESSKLPVYLIIDGEINYHGLNVLSKNISWLNILFSKNNISIDSVSYAFYYKSCLYVIKK